MTAVHPRNPELEAVVRARPDDRDAHLVYADWLQSQGFPQGDLIAAQLAGEREPKKARRLKMRATKLLEDFIESHCIPMFPALAHRFGAREDDDGKAPDGAFASSVSIIRWRWGLIRRIGTWSWPKKLAAPALDLLAHPLAMFLDEVILRDACGAAVEDLALFAPMRLRVLEVPDAEIADLAPLAGHTGLVTLNLCRTRVAKLDVLAGMTELRDVDLTGTKVADIAPLLGLEKLFYVKLSKTRVSKAAAEHLEAVMRDRPAHRCLGPGERPMVWCE